MNLFENLQAMNESANADFVKKECEKYGINKSSYGSRYMELYLEPTDNAVEKFINKIEADGYKFISKQEDGPKNSVYENDVTLIYGKEVEGNRCIMTISIHPSEDSLRVSCGYDEDENDNEFFENLQNRDEPEEIIEWDEDVFDDLYDDGEEPFVEAKSASKSNISKMTYKGQRIQNQDWAEFRIGSYVEILNPYNNKALDLKPGVSGYGKLAGKVKETYVYDDGADNLTAGGSNHNYNELDPYATQSCVVEVHDDFKVSQHGSKTNRVIIPIEFLKETDEKTYKDIVNKIPRKGFDKLFNKNKKRIEANDIANDEDDKETLTEDYADPKETLQNKANKFAAMVDALGNGMSESEVNAFLRNLTNELDMDIYEDDKPYQSELDGYFGVPVAELNLNDEDDAELFNWVDDILTDCIMKAHEFIENRIEVLNGEISAIETDINELKAVIKYN